MYVYFVQKDWFQYNFNLFFKREQDVLVMGGYKIVVAKIGGRNFFFFFDADFL